MATETTVQLVGGPTVIFELGGLRLVTDPTFDPPGHFGEPGGLESDKTIGPALQTSDLGRIDVVLLSHDQHFDNLDDSGRQLIGDVAVTLTTPAGAERLGGNVQGLAPFESTTLERPDNGTLTVTAVPARHGPEGVEAMLGHVTGFWLQADDIEPIYVTGDNASLDNVRLIAHRLGSPDVIVQFVGGVRDPHVLDGQLLTMDGLAARLSADILRPRRVAFAHAEGWAHFGEDRQAAVDAFAAGGISDLLVETPPGAVVGL